LIFRSRERRTSMLVQEVSFINKNDFKGDNLRPGAEEHGV
jgi:hypothetical protein